MAPDKTNPINDTVTSVKIDRQISEMDPKKPAANPDQGRVQALRSRLQSLTLSILDRNLNAPL